MIRKKIDHLDLLMVSQSGQCFRWRRTSENSFNIIAFGKSLDISQFGDEFELSCSQEEWQEIWYDYFDMDTDYCSIEELILSSEDEHLIECFKRGSGIRILKQDVWEMVISFMISQNNNIKRITNTVEMLCDACGKSITGSDRKAFPAPGEVSPEVFSDKSFGFGYRDVYLREMFEYALLGLPEIYELLNVSYDEAMKRLLRFKGIGAKVANCICLFGLHHISAFPVDTHVRQLLDKYYADGFDFERFGECAGIIQQYLFYYELMNR